MKYLWPMNSATLHCSYVVVKRGIIPKSFELHLSTMLPPSGYSVTYNFTQRVNHALREGNVQMKLVPTVGYCHILTTVQSVQENAHCLVYPILLFHL